MAELHDALKQLGPVQWSEVPEDGLEQYLTDAFTAGELICNSIPQLPNGTPFEESKPHHHIPNFAKSHKDIHPSEARQQPPVQEHADLAKQWGKPIKFSAKDNPLKVSLYKMAGHDRHGAWFARRSVHEGLGFDKWKRAMLREFSETMAVKGGPGAGAIRGLAADRRLENKEVKGVGSLEVYQLSAQFPGPVTPRDFVEMLLGTDDALSKKSAAETNGTLHVPRHFMVISKPVDHPDTPERSGYVRGHYESVEMIREIPLSQAKSKPASDRKSEKQEMEEGGREQGHSGSGSSENAADASHDPELNPVEWIMVTRSDPGGGIPRFLVDRGTPETMIADLHKFFNWACSKDHIPDPDEDLEEREGGPEADAAGTDEKSQTTNSIPESTGADTATTQAPPASGFVGGLAAAIGTGIDTYAPTSVANLLHARSDIDHEAESSDDSSDTSSNDSFLSAEEVRRTTTASDLPLGQANDSVDVLSIASGDVSDSSNLKNMNHHDKEIHKLAQKREKLNQQLAKKRISEEAKFKQSQEKEESDATKAREEMEKRLKKTEEKHKKEIEKLEQKKIKEQKKAEERRRKKDDSNKLSLVTRERDEFRSQSDLFKRENALLREQVAELQTQNSVMAQKLASIGGKDVLKTVQDELGHGRTKSTKSIGSATSSDSVAKNPSKDGEGVSVPTP